ncbi:nitroreductase [Ottowia thiooxydans]|uniref:nitroreductase n=1 Tax=Ottowia thiooxydans TaxID=219182 RepID=UPI0004905B58|nr:nitroreductase [Ottowia thiooxydans]
MSQLNALIPDPSSVDAAIENRFCVRAFLPDQVPREMLEEVLRLASRAPSGSNAQPWKVYVLQGAAKAGLVEKTCAAHDALREHPELESKFRPDYDYYPRSWVDPYRARRRQNGLSLYGLLGIGKGESDKMHAQHQRNFKFFDAPVGLMFTLDRGMGQGSLMDYGMFMQNLMVAARARGLHSCAQAAWNTYSSIVLEHIGAGPQEMLVCGMSLGFPDKDALVNEFSTPRDPVQAFTHWLE